MRSENAVGKVFKNYEVEKALKEVLEIQQGKGSWDDWESRWSSDVKKKASKEMKIFNLLGWLKK